MNQPNPFVRVGAQGELELIVDEKLPDIPVVAINAQTAAYLGRELLSGASAVFATNAPRKGSIVGDAEIPILKFQVGASQFDANPILRFTVAPGVELSFRLAPALAKALGDALQGISAGTLLPGQNSGPAH
jgi:hypothetical protein